MTNCPVEFQLSGLLRSTSLRWRGVDQAEILMFIRSEKGQGLAEYALILALIAILAIAALGVLSGAINGILSSVGAAL
jgi:pilus assembly protein Flp/PilA